MCCLFFCFQPPLGSKRSEDFPRKASSLSFSVSTFFSLFLQLLYSENTRENTQVSSGRRKGHGVRTVGPIFLLRARLASSASVVWSVRPVLTARGSPPETWSPSAFPFREQSGRSCMRQAHDVTGGFSARPPKPWDGQSASISKLQPCHSSRGGSRDRAHAGQLRLWGGCAALQEQNRQRGS